MKTYSPKKENITRSWHLFDARTLVLGRLASQASHILMGKHKTTFSRHLDMGDNVVIINAGSVNTTGRKSQTKLYRHHSGYPGGMKVTTFSQMQAKDPARIIIQAVSGMLPDNKLKSQILRHLHVYPADIHPYTKQFKSHV